MRTRYWTRSSGGSDPSVSPLPSPRCSPHEAPMRTGRGSMLRLEMYRRRAEDVSPTGATAPAPSQWRRTPPRTPGASGGSDRDRGRGDAPAAPGMAGRGGARARAPEWMGPGTAPSQIACCNRHAQHTHRGGAIADRGRSRGVLAAGPRGPRGVIALMLANQSNSSLAHLRRIRRSSSPACHEPLSSESRGLRQTRGGSSLRIAVPPRRAGGTSAALQQRWPEMAAV